MRLRSPITRSAWSIRRLRSPITRSPDRRFMALFPQRFIDDLRLQANIAQVVQDFVPLKRAGRTYKGLCPFHSEKTPSFHVDPEKGFFHCFGCGVGGDIFKFLELHEKLGFQDAVRMLAQKFGVALPEEREGASED